MISKKTQNTVPNIWTAQENLIHFYRLLAVGLGVLVVLLLILMGVFYFRDPIVVVREGNSQEFYSSKRSKVAIEKSDVEAFTRNFLTSLYVWSSFDSEKLAREISPFSEAGLVSKVIEGHTQRYAKELKGKKIAQDIAFVSVQVLEDRVVAGFDRLLKIEGIPLVIRTEVVLSMIQGTPTKFNPVGIYVAGIQEHDGAK